MDKGHCDQDRKHLANATVGYQTPEVGNRAVRPARIELAGVRRPQHPIGQWLNIMTGVDNALNGQLQQRPNKVSDDVYGPKTLNNYLNRAAFASPAPGTFGNLEYRGVEGPGYWSGRHGAIQADQPRRDSNAGTAGRGLQRHEPVQLGRRHRESGLHEPE